MTSIQFIYTEEVLPKMIFSSCYDFCLNKLMEGPEFMKKMFLSDWNMLREKYKDRKDLGIQDIDREVTLADFNVTSLKTNNGIKIFYFEFPDHQYRGAAKYVALALTPREPYYLTLEYAIHAKDGEPYWAVCQIDRLNIHRYLGWTNEKMPFTEWVKGFVESMKDI